MKTRVSCTSGAMIAAYAEGGTSASTQYIVGPMVPPRISAGIKTVHVTRPHHRMKKEKTTMRFPL